jgi:hypothetical protein
VDCVNSFRVPLGLFELNRLYADKTMVRAIPPPVQYLPSLTNSVRLSDGITKVLYQYMSSLCSCVLEPQARHALEVSTENTMVGHISMFTTVLKLS